MDLEHQSEQSEWSTIDNLRRIIEHIDGIFGNGYSKEHPELLGQLVTAAAIDYGATIIYSQLEELTAAVSCLESTNNE